MEYGALETSTIEGAATIANGDYNLRSPRCPRRQETLVLAGANDLWKCSLRHGLRRGATPPTPPPA